MLDNISFKIEAGEKIALVGLNGVGKTTLTMLMYGLFGLVPQQFNLLAVSIARNIASAASDEEIDYDKLQHCIEVAGLSEKIKTLHNGAATLLNRTLY